MALTLIARGGVPLDLDRSRVLFFDKAAVWALVQRYGISFVPKLYEVSGAGELELRDMDALAFFLWAGLQADAKEHGEELTLEQVDSLVTPLKIQIIFLRVVLALARGNSAPATLGKETAAAASPAGVAESGPGPAMVSTSMKRSASPSRSSAKRPRSSGRAR